MLQKHAVLQVTIRLDPTPGTFHTSGDVESRLIGLLADFISHYNSTVKLLHTVQTEGVEFEEDSPKVEKTTSQVTLTCVSPDCDLIFESLKDVDIFKQRILHPMIHAGSHEFMHVIRVIDIGVQDNFATEIVEDWEKQKQEEIDAVSRVMNICPTCKVVAGSSSEISCDDDWHTRNIASEDEKAYQSLEGLKQALDEVLPKYMGHGITKIRNRRRD